MKKKLLLIALFLSPILFMGVWLGGGGTLWKLINGNTLKPAMSNWKVDIGTVSMDTLYLGAKRLYENGIFLYSPDRIESKLELATAGDVKADLYLSTGGYLKLDNDGNDSATYISFHNRDTLWVDTLHNLKWDGNSFLGDSGKTTTIGKGGQIIMPSADLTDTMKVIKTGSNIVFNNTAGYQIFKIAGTEYLNLGANYIIIKRNVYPYVAYSLGLSNYPFSNLYLRNHLYGTSATAGDSTGNSFPIVLTSNADTATGTAVSTVSKTITIKDSTAFAGDGVDPYYKLGIYGDDGTEWGYWDKDKLKVHTNTELGDSANKVWLNKGTILYGSSPSLSDTGYMFVNDGSMVINSKNSALYLRGKNSTGLILDNNYVWFYRPLIPQFDNTEDIGGGGYKVRNFYIAGSIVDSTGMISGSGTFPATYTCDTFLLSGVVSTDVIQAGWKGATIPNKPLTAVAGIDTIFIYCDVSDTTKARAEGFTYIRFNHK